MKRFLQKWLYQLLSYVGFYQLFSDIWNLLKVDTFHMPAYTSFNIHQFTEIKSRFIQTIVWRMIARSLEKQSEFYRHYYVNSIWEVWETTQHARLAKLLIARNWLATDPIKLKIVSNLLAKRQKLRKKGYSETLRLLAQLYNTESDNTLWSLANQLLRTPANNTTTNMNQKTEPLCEVLLADLMARKDFIVNKPLPLLVFIALRANLLESLKGADERVIAPLLHLQLCNDADMELATSARDVLLHLKQPATQDAFCRLALESQQDLARSLVLEADYQPHDNYERALFLFLTRQWQRYDSFDFDQHLLKFIYEVSDSNIRKQIMEIARQEGRVEQVSSLANLSQKNNLSYVSNDEWKLMIDLLTQSQRWEEAWELALKAPPVWSSQIIWYLAHIENWQPPKHDEYSVFSQLRNIAQEWNVSSSLRDYFLSNNQMKKLAYNLTRNWTAATNGGLTISTGKGITASSIARVMYGERYMETIYDWNIIVNNDQHFSFESNEWSSRDLRGKPFDFGGPSKERCLAINPTNPNLLACLETVIASRDNSIRTLIYLLDKRNSSNLPLTATLIEESVSLERYSEFGPQDIEFATMSLDFSPDGQILASSCVTGLKLWNMYDYSALTYFKMPEHYITNQYPCLKFSPDGTLFAAKNLFGLISIWRVADGELLASFGFDSPDVKYKDTVLVFTKDNRTLISSDSQNRIQIWSLPDRHHLKAWSSIDNTFKPTDILEEEYDGIYSIALNPNEEILATGHKGLIWLWHLPTRQPIRTFSLAEPEPIRGSAIVQSLGFSENNQYLVSIALDVNIPIRIWATPTGFLEICLKPPAQTKIDDLAFVQALKNDANIPHTERRWAEYVEILLGWHYKHEVEIAELTESETGQYDIELESAND